MSIQRHYTTVEAAEILRVSPLTVMRKCASGEIPATKVARQWRISEAALAAALEPTNAPVPEQPRFITASAKRRARQARLNRHAPRAS